MVVTKGIQSVISQIITEEQIRRRAWKLWIDRGRRDGHEKEDWVEAERQLRNETLQRILDGCSSSREHVMQAGLIVRTFIASPGDVLKERELARKVVAEWNAAHSLDRGAIVEAVMIETHAQTALGQHPQEIINRQLLDRCDFLIAIFWSKLGTPTNKEKSGTIHEIVGFADQKGPENVLLFFSKKDYPADTNLDCLKELKQFQNEMQSRGLYIDYKDHHEFETKLRQQLEMRLNQILVSDVAQSLWSKKARMNEQDRISTESLEDQTKVMSGIQRQFVDEMGREETPADTCGEDQGRHKRALAEKLLKLADAFSEQWRTEQSEYRINSVSPKEMLEITAATVWDTSQEHANVLGESIRKRVWSLCTEITKLGEGARNMTAPNSSEYFWNRGYELARQLKTLASMI